MEYGNSTGWWLKGDKNVALQTTKAGEYLFIFRANENNEISVVIPAPDPIEKPKFYVTGNAALVGEELQWNPAAIKSMTDTLVLDLKVDQNYMLKLTLDGEWNEHVLGFDALTEKAEGLTRGEGSDNDNICFSMAEDGKVNVIYFVENEKVTFKLEGKFYVAPVELPKVAIAGAMNDWNENANVMKAAEDGLTASVTMSLEAKDYDFKVVVDGHWLHKEDVYEVTRENPKAESVNQEVSYGPSLKLKADAEGEYTFTWTYATNTVVVTFPDAPIVEKPKFYVTGNAAIAGDKAWTPDAIKSMTDTLVLSLTTDTVVMRLTLDGTWEGEQRDFRHLTDTAAGLYEEIDEYSNHNIRFVLKEAGNVTIIYNEKEFKLIGNFYVDEPQPQTLEDGYYLIGQKGWDLAALDASLLFVANEGQDGEFKLDVTLKENDPIKVVKVEADVLKIWYPEGEGNEYVVDAKHAGAKTVYFRPAGNSEWSAFGGFIYIEANHGAGFENIDASEHAVKLMHNGQVVILRGDKVYTVMGQKIQ